MRFLFLRCVCFLLLACGLALPATVAAEDYQQASSRLQRGVFYYHYLNDDYQPALNTLNAWQAEQAGTAGESELTVMKAGLLISLGLYRDAETLFHSLHSQTAPGDAWFYLARAWLAEGRYDAVADCAARALNSAAAAAEHRLNPAYTAEAQFMLITALAHADRVEDARTLLQQMPDDDLWSGYARYNLLIALIRNYAPRPDIDRLSDEAVYFMPATEEGRALRDRVLLVSGIYALDNGQPQQAAKRLSQVGLESPLAAPALLQYGWALSAQLRYRDAMQPWRVLQQQYQPFHPAVLESLLAVPHALELLNATSQSMHTYEFVEQRLQTMLAQLERFNNPQRIAEWLTPWLAAQPPVHGWQSGVPSTAEADADISRTLQALLDDADFNDRAGQLRELIAMHNHLQQQRGDLDLWDQLLQQRRQYLTTLAGQQTFDRLLQRQQQLSQQLGNMRQALQAEDNKIFAYASAADQQNIQHLQAIVPRINYLQSVNSPTRDLAAYKERWRRMRGLQLWQIYEHKPARQWAAKSTYWQLETDISALEEQLAHTRTALSWADRSWQGFPRQVAEARSRAEQLSQRLERLQQQQQAVLLQQVQTHLTSLQQRVTDYLAQTRLSVARLYDDAQQQSLMQENVSQADAGAAHD